MTITEHTRSKASDAYLRDLYCLIRSIWYNPKLNPKLKEYSFKRTFFFFIILILLGFIWISKTLICTYDMKYSCKSKPVIWFQIMLWVWNLKNRLCSWFVFTSASDFSWEFKQTAEGDFLAWFLGSSVPRIGQMYLVNILYLGVCLFKDSQIENRVFGALMWE